MFGSGQVWLLIVDVVPCLELFDVCCRTCMVRLPIADFAVPKFGRFLVPECARFGSRLPTLFFGFISSIFIPGVYKVRLPIADVSLCLDLVDSHYESMLNLAPNCRRGSLAGFTRCLYQDVQGSAPDY